MDSQDTIALMAAILYASAEFGGDERVIARPLPNCMKLWPLRMTNV
jgi:hypothetical protein